MANKVESIPTALGKLRKGLMDEGYTQDQAFWLVQDLVRKAESPTALVED
ncbi:hypothetical protein [uncultured Arthrobacter sp.]|nr:hypothetical protein [uncultured Arthrobacter sp.]